MKKITQLIPFLLAASIIIMTGCEIKPKEMTVEQKAVVSDTINTMMNEMIEASEAVDAVTALNRALMDSTIVYYFNGTPYGHCDMVTMVSDAFGKLAWQNFDITWSHVFVPSPDAALWVGEGTCNAADKEGIEKMVQFTLTVYWMRERGKWGIHHYHESYSAIPE
ncbi:nuclear transport factor 2 family protein [Bacteroidota bacterium]